MPTPDPSLAPVAVWISEWVEMDMADYTAAMDLARLALYAAVVMGLLVIMLLSALVVGMMRRG